ncbi:AAA family ATPase [Anaerofustis sp.]|uniref:cytidylate kinase-like family protein n=1 Tax=Anaerofustis sp. TaxID=1872517 RepID=UPI0025BAA2ED|nr:cytidylate kinase-like family protein [Anaerofustis sp.]
MKKIIVTIGREYGSGGRLIAKKVSELLNIPFYDEELINLIVKETGLAADYIRNADTRRPLSFFSDVSFSYDNLPIEDQLLISENDVIKKVADKGSCVIVGLCADYVLRDYENCIKIFVTAPLEERIERAKNKYNINCKNIEHYILKIDKSRAKYYNYVTDEKWNSMKNYDLIINSSIGLDSSAELIKSLVEIKERELDG